MTEETSSASAPRSIRYASDAIMAQLARDLVRESKISQQQLNELNTRQALTGDSKIGRAHV